jgi:hypothetical protein
MKRFLILTATILLGSALHSQSAAQWAHDFRYGMEIPQIMNIQSSETHLYVLSESEGLIVFRTYDDDLEWLYSSTGMQQRGHILESDIRFAYLYGDNRRLTVVEPTSVLGVYSSTVLPHRPLTVKRISDYLYIAMGDNGLGKISLKTPDDVDAGVESFDPDRLDGRRVHSLATDNNLVLYVLSNRRTLDIYEFTADTGEEGELVHADRVETDIELDKIFLTDEELIGTDRNGNIYLIDSNGRTRTTASVNAPVERLEIWNDQLAVRTQNGSMWLGSLGGDLTEWKSDEHAGNYFTVTGNQLWATEFDRLSPVVQSERRPDGETASDSGPLRLQEIDDITIPFPRPLLLPIKLENGSYSEDVSFSYSAPFSNARIRGNTFYWQPSANQTGRHTVTITASNSAGQRDSQSFTIDLRPFNAPPRLSSSQPVTIPVDESFEFQITAVDPDGLNPDLIRYLGVDLPDGARLNERTGVLTWTPNIRQVGSHRFQVIATDQFGAASSQNYEIRVIEMDAEPDSNTQN